MMTSDRAITERVSRGNTTLRHNLPTSLTDLTLIIGGGITSDGLKQRFQRRKYIDLVINYFNVPSRYFMTIKQTVTRQNKVIKMEEHSGPESIADSRSFLDDGFQKRFGINFNALLRNFKMVTDCARTITCIVGAYRSCRKVSF